MKRHKSKNKIFDELLRHATARQLEKLSDGAPAEKDVAAKYTFSREFEEKMQRLFAQQRRYEQNARLRKTALKIAVVILVCFTLSAITVMSVDAWRVHVLNFLSEVGEKSTTIRINGGETDSGRFIEEAQEMYLPAYIPEEYLNESIEKVGNYYLVTYINDAGNMIRLQKLPSGSSVGIDSEDALTEQFFINGELAQYFFKNEIGNLLFKFNENAFLITAPLTKVELIKIAESMQYRE